MLRRDQNHPPLGFCGVDPTETGRPPASTGSGDTGRQEGSPEANTTAALVQSCPEAAAGAAAARGRGRGRGAANVPGVIRIGRGAAPVVRTRAAERRLEGLLAVEVAAERLRIMAETLGHQTAAGNLKLKLELNVRTLL